MGLTNESADVAAEEKAIFPVPPIIGISAEACSPQSRAGWHLDMLVNPRADCDLSCARDLLRNSAVEAARTAARSVAFAARVGFRGAAAETFLAMANLRLERRNIPKFFGVTEHGGDWRVRQMLLQSGAASVSQLMQAFSHFKFCLVPDEIARQAYALFLEADQRS